MFIAKKHFLCARLPKNIIHFICEIVFFLEKNPIILRFSQLYRKLRLFHVSHLLDLVEYL